MGYFCLLYEHKSAGALEVGFKESASHTSVSSISPAATKPIMGLVSQDHSHVPISRWQDAAGCGEKGA